MGLPCVTDTPGNNIGITNAILCINQTFSVTKLVMDQSLSLSPDSPEGPAHQADFSRSPPLQPQGP